MTHEGISMLEKFIDELQKQAIETRKSSIDNMLKLKKQKLDRLVHLTMRAELEIEMLTDLQKEYQEAILKGDEKDDY